MLYGREREREHLRALIDGASRDGHSFAVVLEGPAGIGKSALLDELLDETDGVLILRAAGYEAEADIPFAGLTALLAPVAHLRDRLAETQRAALGGALALEPSPPGDRFAVPVALLGLLGAIAEQQPLLVVVDDAHWLDASTREAVLFVAQRLVAEGIGVLLAVREADGAPVVAPSLERLRLSPLGRDDAVAILAEGQTLAPDVSEALLVAGGGNPLALRELPRALTPAQRAGHAPLDGPPAAGSEVQAAFVGQLAALPPETAAALVVLAAGLGNPPAVVTAALDRAGHDREALAPAFAAGLLVERDGQLGFRHPLLASAAYHGVPSSERRRAHAALAAVVADPPRRAWQLAAAALAPDASAAAALAVAGQDARDAGAHADAARAFGRAAELEPDPATSAGLALEAARDHALAGHGTRSLELVERTVREAPDPILRTAAEHLHAHLLMRGGAPVAAAARLEALAEGAMAAGDRTRGARLLLEASLAHMFTGDMEALLAIASRAREGADGVDDELALLAGLVGGEALLALGRSAEGDALIAAAEPLLFVADPRSEIAEVVSMAAMSSLWVERFARVERIVGRMVALAREAGAAGRLVYPLSVRAQLHWRCGRWAAAYADAEESVRLARDTGQTGVLALTLAVLGRAEAGIGRLAEARAHCQEGIALSEVAAGEATVLHSLAALGFTELSAGRADLAVAPLERAAGLDLRLGHGEPALTMYAADLVEALARAGRREDAQRALDGLAAGAARTGGAWAHAATERGRLLLAAEDELEAHAEVALGWHERVAMPFERARTELVLGERLRRTRRRAEARDWLDRAQRGFERLGAEPWAARARTELRATGARAVPHVISAVEELTPHELQVALLVAEGRTNREVGSALFLSPKTIEHHLGSIYRKLGLRSRTQLAARMADQLPERDVPVPG